MKFTIQTILTGHFGGPETEKKQPYENSVRGVSNNPTNLKGKEVLGQNHPAYEDP